ncbi:hepatitis A virus cellular receptor 1 homolog [Mus pahari]|uniref:hepatitis A virus cellular receptor 1 homolog n=1 Tax=Mus pahari TaxID=10093 RepID=UPI000A30F923|nr:hepatitis A virus cellular receptor 1 homolog [Mus pahari]
MNFKICGSNIRPTGLSAAVHSFPEVHGVVGHSVTLPCMYPVSTRKFYMCWGRGPCGYNTCGERLIASDGYSIQYRANNRYQLKGQLLQGNASLTILHLTESDSGHYCCGFQMKGWYGIREIITPLLLVRPEISTSPPTRLSTTRPTTTGRPTTISTRSTHVPTSTRVSTSTPPTSAHTQTYKPDWNNTVTSSDNSWNNNTEAIPPQKPHKNLTKGLYVGICIAVLLLLLLVGTVVIIRYMVRKKKSGSLSFPVSKIRPLQNTVVVQSKGEDKIYIIEDTANPGEQSQWPSEAPSA